MPWRVDKFGLPRPSPVSPRMDAPLVIAIADKRRIRRYRRFTQPALHQLRIVVADPTCDPRCGSQRSTAYKVRVMPETCHAPVGGRGTARVQVPSSGAGGAAGCSTATQTPGLAPLARNVHIDRVSTGPHAVPPLAMIKEVPMLRGRILVVEDDPAITTVLEETLTAEAYEVVRTGAPVPLQRQRPFPLS